MSARVIDAEEALADAQSAYSSAQAAAQVAQAHADSLAAQIAAGESTASSSELAQVHQEAGYAALVAEGAASRLPALQAAVVAAQGDEVCDSICSTLPPLGSALLTALASVSDALVEYVTTAETFDAAVTSARAQVETLGGTCPRVKLPRYGVATVDGLQLGQSRADRLLASVVAPVLRKLGTPAFAVSELNLLADAATSIPTA